MYIAVWWVSNSRHCSELNSSRAHISAQNLYWGVRGFSRYSHPGKYCHIVPNNTMNASLRIISSSLFAVITLFDTLHHRSSTRRPPAYVVRPAATSVNYAFIRSFCSLCFDRSKVSSKASSPRARSSASSFNFQHALASFRSPSSSLLFLPRLPITSTLASVFPSITCFNP